MLDQDFIEKLHYEFGSSSGAKCTRWIKSMDFYHIQLKCITTTLQHKFLKSQFDNNSCVKFNFISLYCLDTNITHLFIMSRHEYHVHYLYMRHEPLCLNMYNTNLWKNKFHTITIVKSLFMKFVMYVIGFNPNFTKHDKCTNLQIQ